MVKSYIITAAVIAGLFAGGTVAWQTQNWRYASTIAKMKQESAESHNQALELVIAESTRMENQKNEAIAKAEERAREYKVLADRNSVSVTSMHNKLKAAESRYAQATSEALIRHASVIAGVTESCLAEYQKLGVEAIGIASDLELMIDSWPR